jgi:hypothetical protein
MELTRRRVLAARTIAVLADAVQIGLLPLFSEGVFSVANDALDVAVAVTLVLLVGWHWAFIPAFVSELVPMVDLVPTWTASVLLATRGAATPAIQPGPPPPQLR